MNNSFSKTLIASAIALAFSFSSAIVVAEEPASTGSASSRLSASNAKPEFVESQLANVERLIDSSVSSKQIDDGDNEEAKALKAKAKGLYEKAKQAYENGDMAEASQLVKQASRTMFEGVRVVGAGPALEKKRREDYTKRLESTEALIEALDRVAEEKGEQAKASEVKQNVRTIEAEAAAKYEEGALKEARKMLDVGYEMVKLTVEEMREGDTLVRSLNFANKQEEYEYEFARNDSQQVLVEVLLSKKREEGSLNRMVDMYLDKSKTLRKEAEELADSGDFDKAVDVMEESTQFLHRALRMGGIYVPS